MTLLLILFQKEIWLPFFILWFYFPHKDIRLFALGLGCTQSPGWFLVELSDAGEHQEPWAGILISQQKERWLSSQEHSQRPWGVNYCFSLSPFTLCIPKLLSLPINSHTADSSILLGASPGPAPSSPTFAVLLLGKVGEERYMNFTTNRVFPCQVIFDPESDTRYLSQGHILKHF